MATPTPPAPATKTPVSLAFRRATEDDVPALLDLIISAYRGISSRQGWTTEADFLADDRIDEAGLLAKIRAPRGAVIYVTNADNTDSKQPPLGCCEVSASEGAPEHGGGVVAYFGLFAVPPTKQGGGVGSQVLKYAEDFARRELGANRIEMWVIWLRDDIRAWYLRRGYAMTGRTTPFPYDGLVNGPALRDDLYMDILSKDL